MSTDSEIIRKPSPKKMSRSACRQLNALILIVPVLVGYLFVILSFSEEGFEFRYNSLFLSAILLYFLIIIIKTKVLDVEHPILAVFVGLFFFNVFGSVNSGIISNLWPESQLDIENTLEFVNYGFLSVFLGFLTVKAYCRIFKGCKEMYSTHLYAWNITKLRLLIYILFTVSSLCFLGFYSTGGRFVLLMKSPSLEYMSMFAEVSPFFLRAYYLTFRWLTLISGIYLLLDRRKKIVLFIFLFSVFNVVTTGKRAYMLIPMITIIFCYEYYVRKISLVKWALAAFLILASFVIVGNIRSEKAMASHLDKVRNLFYQTAGEFSAFAQVVHEFPEGKVFEKGLLARATFLPALPQPIWVLFGYNKNLNLKPTNPEIKFLLRRNRIHAGTRIGIIGELFLGFGFSGIFVGMYIFGIILSVVNFLIRKCHKNDARLVIYTFLVTIMLYSIVGEWNEVFSYMWNGVYLLTFIYFLCRKKVFIID